MKKRVYIAYTGGTIGMTKTPEGYAPAYGFLEAQIAAMPELRSDLMPDGSRVWSAYWHVTQPVVSMGQAVKRGDRIADVLNRGFNSHLHWEVRTFGDGTALFPADSAGGRGACNGRVPALGYTWDDDPTRAKPDYWGYRDQTRFVDER